jgi:hypothetical protein
MLPNGQRSTYVKFTDASSKDTRGLTSLLLAFLSTTERKPLARNGFYQPGQASFRRPRKLGDVPYDFTAVGEGAGAQIQRATRGATRRTHPSPGTDRPARSLHGRDRAVLVPARRQGQPFRKSAAIADATLVRGVVASPRRYPAYRGVAHRHWHEGCGSHLDQPCWCPRDSLRPRSIRRRSKPGRMRLLHWRLLPMTPWTIFLDIIPVLALGLAIVSLPLIADGPPRRRDPAKE